MAYTSRYAGPDLTVEEQDVATALSRYTTAGASRTDWVSTAALWRTYCQWWAEHRWRFDPDAPARLTIRQFGRAVHRVFKGVTVCEHHRGKHKYSLGYRGLLGPESIYVEQRVSNPSNQLSTTVQGQGVSQ